MTEQELASEAEVAKEAEMEAEAQAKLEEETKTEDKRPSSVAKLLAQRNESRAKAAELEAKVGDSEKLAKKVSELEELVAKQTLDSEAKAERSDFFNKNTHAKEFESDIESIRASKNLSYEDAAKLVIAEKKPELLLEDAVRNKMSGWAPLTGTAKANEFDWKNPQEVDDISKMSDDEFLKRGNEQAKKERMIDWKVR